MSLPQSAPVLTLQDKCFLLLLLGVSVAFVWVLWPFYSAVFWAAVFALMFTPLHLRLLKKMPGKPTLAGLITVSAILVLVILPVGLIVVMLTQEAASVYQRVQSGELNIGVYLQQAYNGLPGWITNLLARFGLTDFALIQERIVSSFARGTQFFATQALSIGQNAFDFFISFFIMLYMLFFLLRDGASLSRRIHEAIPLDENIKRQLLSKFTTVIRATVKGNVVVAAIQGFLGAVIFAFMGIHAAVLWGTLMAFLSLLPAVGAALVWLPVAIYFLVTGAVLKGIVLIAYGVLVIGLVDNILRPVLVGKDTKIPDYVILVSTLGGMAIFGLNGFVIGPLVAAMFIAAWAIFAAARPESVDPAIVDNTPEAAPNKPAIEGEDFKA